MSKIQMTSLERVLKTLGQEEPDRVPMFLMLTMHGAKELGMTIKEYFSKAENVVEGQLKLRKKYNNDCIYSFFYAAVEIEAWGGEVIYFEDGPPNSGEPFIRSFDQINNISIPDIRNTACLGKVLTAIESLKANVENEVPIIGVAMSPYSLPVMQLGFEKYLELLYYKPKEFSRLMKVNEAFCISWANAQLEAGATAICYFDPLASPTIIEKEMYKKTGFEVAKRVIPQINGPTATHLASGRATSVIDELVATGTFIAGISSLDDIDKAKEAANKRLTLLGNLNGLEMIDWKIGQAEIEVKNIIRKGGKDGGLIVSDNHGEIPWQVSDDVLLEVSEAVKKWGNYPLDWI